MRLGQTTRYPRLRLINGPKLYGVTFDTVTKLTGSGSIVECLTNLTRFPTSRVVFDNIAASNYTAACSAINPVSYVMGLLVDSTDMHMYADPVNGTYTAGASAYSARVKSYLDTLGTSVDIWEVGNEVNGEWCLTSGAPTTADTANIVAMLLDAYHQVKARGYRTSLTLYYNGPQDNGSASCWSQSANAMLYWASTNVPTEMKNGLDYVLVSFYEEDCTLAAYDATTMNSVFASLQTMFPNSKVGFGENGAHPTDTATRKISGINYWYGSGMNLTPSNYVSGHFWWYGYQDLLPYSSNSVWTAFNNATAAN